MDISPDALYNAINTDLSHHLRSVPGDILFSKEQLEFYPGASETVAACISLRNSIIKKYAPPDGNKDADQAAITLFLKNNQACAVYELPTQLSELEFMVMSTVKHKFYTMFGGVSEFVPTLSQISNGFGLGNGSSLGAVGNSLYEKLFGGDMTTTSNGLYRLYVEALDGSRWVAGELSRFTEFGPPKVVKNSSASLVPKNEKISRFICTEPSLNMLFQKGISSILARALKHFYNIDMSTQQARNKKLAQIGSLLNSNATIDMRSASDLISLILCNEVVPDDLLNWMLYCSTPFCQLPDGSSVPLHMISTMGNGYTSTFQTILFATIIDSVYSTLGIRRTDDNFGVYGDDMICAKEAYPLVCRILTLYGLSVNTDKSYNDGYFRESCGGDFYKGTDIRGVYCQSLETIQDIYSLINRLVRWSAIHNIWLSETIALLTRKVRKRNFLPIPPFESDDAGVHVPLNIARSNNLRGDTNGSVCYTAFVARTPFYVVLTNAFSAIVAYKSGKPIYEDSRLFYNADGVLVSALGGYLRNGRLSKTVNQDRTYYSKKRKTAPCWDYNSLALDRFDRGGWERWLRFSFAYFWTANTH